MSNFLLETSDAQTLVVFWGHRSYSQHQQKALGMFLIDTESLSPGCLPVAFQVVRRGPSASLGFITCHLHHLAAKPECRAHPPLHGNRISRLIAQDVRGDVKSTRIPAECIDSTIVKRTTVVYSCWIGWKNVCSGSTSSLPSRSPAWKHEGGSPVLI